MRRRRAAGGPAEQTFAALVGLRAAAAPAAGRLGAVGRRCAPGRAWTARDAVWAHPDLLPTAADLDDPLGFREGAVPASESLSDDEFDAALADLLDNESGESGPDSPAGPTDT